MHLFSFAKLHTILSFKGSMAEYSEKTGPLLNKGLLGKSSLLTEKTNCSHTQVSCQGD